MSIEGLSIFRSASTNHSGWRSLSREEVEILEKRAKAFLRFAEQAFKEGEYDLSCFFAEQAAQLCLKSLSLKLFGEVLRTHRVRELLALISTTLRDWREMINEFVQTYRAELRILEEAYIASRYLTTSFQVDDAKAAIDVAKEVIKLCKKISETS